MGAAHGQHHQLPGRVAGGGQVIDWPGRGAEDGAPGERAVLAAIDFGRAAGLVAGQQQGGCAFPGRGHGQPANAHRLRQRRLGIEDGPAFALVHAAPQVAVGGDVQGVVAGVGGGAPDTAGQVWQEGFPGQVGGGLAEEGSRPGEEHKRGQQQR